MSDLFCRVLNIPDSVILLKLNLLILELLLEDQNVHFLWSVDGLEYLEVQCERLDSLLMNNFVRFLSTQASIHLKPSLIKQYIYLIRKYISRSLSSKVTLAFLHWAELWKAYFEMLVFFAKNYKTIPFQADISDLAVAILGFLEFVVYDGRNIFKNDLNPLYRLFAHMTLNEGSLRYVIKLSMFPFYDVFSLVYSISRQATVLNSCRCF